MEDILVIAQAMLITEEFTTPLGEPRRWKPKALPGWVVQCWWCNTVWAEIRIIVKDDNGARALPHSCTTFRNCKDCGRGSLLEEIERSAFLVQHLWAEDVLPTSQELLVQELDAIERNWTQ